MSPGVIGWLIVGAVVITADGIAKVTNRPTMSDEFASNYGLSVIVLAGTAAHLLVHRRRDG